MNNAVDADVAQAVEAVGATRRVQALIAKGFPAVILAARLGIHDDPNLAQLATATQIPASLDTAVRALFDELRDDSPFEHGAVRKSYRAARDRARRRGWVRPDAWDTDTIDDPAAVPEVTPRVPRPLVVAENYADMRELVGGDDRAIAALLRMPVNTLQKNLRRARQLAARQDSIHDHDFDEVAA